MFCFGEQIGKVVVEVLEEGLGLVVDCLVIFGD